MMAAAELISRSKCVAGEVQVWTHRSERLGCAMKFSLFVPPTSDNDEKCKTLVFLSGLTCTHENFIQKVRVCNGAWMMVIMC